MAKRQEKREGKGLRRKGCGGRCYPNKNLPLHHRTQVTVIINSRHTGDANKTANHRILGYTADSRGSVSRFETEQKILLQPQSNVEATGFVQTLKCLYPGLSWTCNDQIPGFSRTQKSFFPGLLNPELIIPEQMVYNSRTFQDLCLFPGLFRAWNSEL